MLSVDCDFPGNIVVDRIDGDTIHAHQDLRDTEGDWFYFNFRVRGAESRTLRVRFTRSNIIGVRGPAASFDDGRSWNWLGASPENADNAFSCAIPADCHEARFAFGIPYQEADLAAFLARHEGNQNLRISQLCRTPKGRVTELLHAGCIDGACRHRVVLTCRHHSCEAIPNFVLEGIVEAILGESDAGRWLRENVEFLIVPFMDKDGVEDGDQGKNRKPHDHNRDYGESPLYESVRALKSRVAAWSEEKLCLFLDLHCPYIRGGNNEEIFFVGSPDAAVWKRSQEFARVLKDVRRGPLPYDGKGDLPFGQSWNTYEGMDLSSQRWFSALPGMQAAMTIELPYATAGGAEVTPHSARLFGVDLAAAMANYLSTAHA